ncbi:hypothetical protein R1sor_005086 [Riccia sorocarpa]|uniref:Uncharacterized protein n=1 Tax=Riccia sorocarpa TaxID=122646 RepID=A0ABD3HMC0_9MARC
MAEGNARTILLIAMMVSIRASIMRHFEAAQAWHRMLEAMIATIQVMHEETGLIDLRRPKYEMHREAIEFLEQEKIGEFHRLKNEAVLKILEYGRAEVDRSRISVEDLVASMTVDAASDEFEPDRSLEGTSDLQLLRDGAIMRDQISESLYLEHLERDADITFDEGFCVENDSESENESLD